MVIANGSRRTEYEKLKIDEWINGEIVDIQERQNDNKKIKDKETGEIKITSCHEVRLVFKFDGYEFKKYSRWMTASTHKESNLYKKYLSKLTECVPGEDFDLDRLKGKAVKTIWDEELYNGDIYQNLVSIKPLRESDPDYNN